MEAQKSSAAYYTRTIDLNPPSGRRGKNIEPTVLRDSFYVFFVRSGLVLGTPTMDDMIEYIEDTNDIRLQYGQLNSWQSLDTELWAIDEVSILRGTLLKVAEKVQSQQENQTLEYTSGDGRPILLIGEGCRDAQGTNCTRVCQNSTAVFGSWKTQWNCLTLSALALVSPWLDANATIGVADATRRLGVSDISTFDGWPVLQTMYNCASASCSNGNAGGCSLQPIPVSTSHNGLDSTESALRLWYSVLSPVCDNTENNINNDLGGPGVGITPCPRSITACKLISFKLLVSYVFQSAIMVYGWALIRLLNLGDTVDWLLALILQSCGKNYRQTDRYPWQGFLRRVKYSRQASSINAALPDFQEAQCFFVIATQVALIYARPQSADFFGSSNVQSYFDNRAVIQVLALRGILPVALAQNLLHKLGKQSVYTLILAVAAIVLGTISLLSANHASTEEIQTMFDGQTPLDACGTSTSLRTFCAKGPTEIASVPTLVGLASIYIAYITLLCWLMIWRIAISTLWFNNKQNSWSEQCRRQVSMATRILSVATTLLLTGLELLTIGSLVSILGVLQKYLAISSDKWNIGQVIAVLVWAPVISKYIYCSLRKSPALCTANSDASTSSGTVLQLY